MQPNPEAYAVSRRPMDVADFIDVLRRHRGWIVGPTFAGIVIAVVVAFLWPDTYISDGTIRIVPPMVPERFVPSNVNLQLNQRIAAMEQQVRSRGSLQNLINTIGLYPRKKGRVPDEDLVEEMNKDIRITPVIALREASDGRISSTAFRVSFRYSDRYNAQKVVTQIISMFQDETARTRSTSSVATSDFLTEKVNAAKKDLDDIENRLTAYKVKFQGKLPEELNSNLAALNSFQTQLSASVASFNRATQDKLFLENALRTAREQLQTAPSNATASMEAAVKNDRLITLERQIAAADAQLAGLRQQYSDSHPDVRRAVAQLNSYRQSRDALLKEEEKKAVPAPKPENPVLTREQRAAQQEVERLQGLIQAKELEIEQIARDQDRLKKLITEYAERIQARPLAERDYSQLTRDYQLAKEQYEDLKKKTDQSSMATELETRKQGETLEVLEQASLPQSPAEPNRWLWVGAGAALGLTAGLLLAAGREVKDTSLKNLKDVRAYTGLPVLGSVPLVENDLLVQRKRRLAWVAWSSACIVGFLLMLGSVYYYFTKTA